MGDEMDLRCVRVLAACYPVSEDRVIVSVEGGSGWSGKCDYCLDQLFSVRREWSRGLVGWMTWRILGGLKTCGCLVTSRMRRLGGPLTT